MKLELKDTEGKVKGTIEIPIEEIKASLASMESSDAQLKESQGKVAELEGKLAKAEGKTLNDYSPEDKANFVITWAKGLSVEDKAIFAEAVGIPITKATDAEVAEAEQKAKAEAEEAEAPKTIQGRTDKPGYKFLENLNLSVRED